MKHRARRLVLLALLTSAGCGGAGTRASSCAPPPAPGLSATRSAMDATEARRRDEVLRVARAQVGKPYCEGGIGPACFDCSGLVELAWRMGAAVRLPRTSQKMVHAMTEVPLVSALPGDVLYWPGHVGLYAGDGMVIDAGSTRRQIAERRVWGSPRAFRPQGA